MLRAAYELLSPRQLEIAQLARSGKTSRQIGAELFIDSRAVDTHIATMCTKLGVRTRVELLLAIFGGNDNDDRPTSERVLNAARGNVDARASEVRELSAKLGLAQTAIAGFFQTLDEAQVPLEQVPAKFQELADRYRDLVESFARSNRTIRKYNLSGQRRRLPLRRVRRTMIGLKSYSRVPRRLIGKRPICCHQHSKREALIWRRLDRNAAN